MKLNSISSKFGGVVFLIFSLQMCILIFAMPLMFNQVHLQKIAVLIILTTATSACMFAFALYLFFTRRLNIISKAIEDFRRSNFTEPTQLEFANSNGDEISRLALLMEQMQRKISDQTLLSKNIELQRREIFENISHDLRTPLTSMRGYLETLLLKIGTISAKQERTYLEVALKQAIYLNKLINDLFELSKLESGTNSAKLENFPLSELMQDVIQKFQLISDEKKIIIQSNHLESNFYTYADIGLVERVLTNLIDNAIRHCSASALINLKITKHENRVHVLVSDTGSGIAQDQLNLIFKRRFQGSNSINKDKDSGAGLGLAITKRIIELHGGSINVSSQLEVGTSFTFDLPAALRPEKK